MKPGRGLITAGALSLGLSSGGCHDAPSGLQDTEPLWQLSECNLEPAWVQDGGVGLDGLPPLTDPPFTGTGSQSDNAYVEDDDRVVGIVVGGQALAIPLGALWYHEIVNLNRGEAQVVVTHGTFSGSSAVYSRAAAGGADFGVTGFLYQNNTLPYDHTTSPSLWDQMTGEARCGPRMGTKLSTVSFLEITWGGWKALYSNTLVLSNAEAINSDWGVYPYGNYERSATFFFPLAMPALDNRREAKERVLGIPGDSEGGIAFPYGVLEDEGPMAVAHASVEGEDLVVFWRSDYQGAAAYWLDGDAQGLTFSVLDGEFVDNETGTTWDFLGVGSGGGSDGVTLDRVSEAVVSYWGAWAAFFPDTDLWIGG